MAKLLIAALVVTLTISCTTQRPEGSNAANAKVEDPSGPLKRHLIAFEEIYPTVGLKDYALVTDNLERDRPEANAVINAKIGLPHAMQTKKREDFEAVLGRTFTFTSQDEFFDREGYIANRVGDPSKVKRADYRNVTVQFIGGRAMVTYSNIVEDQPGGPGAWKADMTWADVFVKENGQWKYEVVHLIDFRDLSTAK